MSPEQLLTLFLILAAVVVMICLTFMWHADQDAELGRALREAAGSEHRARMAVESANLDRLLEQKFDGELAKAERRRATGHKLPSNVIRIAPRILNRGQPVHFEPPGAA